MPISKNSGGAGGGGGSGTVTNVSSANAGIAVANPTTTPVLTVGSLASIASSHASAGDITASSQKITNLANGAGAQDAAAFGQIPTALPPNGTAGGDLSGTYPNPAVKAITETSGPTDLVIGTITDGQVLKRVGSTLVSVAAGAGTVTSVASGDSSLVVTNPTTTPSIQIAALNTYTANVAVGADWSNNSHKITSLANGSAAQDAVAFGQLSGLSYGLSIFGDGSDGSVTFDGSTTILGMVPSSSAYTLTRDFFFSAVTLNSGVQIKPLGFRLYCLGTFTGASGTSIIQMNGTAAAATAGGAGVSNANSPINSGTSTAALGSAGGSGGTTTGSPGTNLSSVTSFGGAGGVGGTGNGGGNAGGAAGTGAGSAPTAGQGNIRAQPFAGMMHLVTSSGFASSPLSGGTGGGGGGGDGTAGGGGGGGGGVVAVYAKTFAGSGAIQANGGLGGTPGGGNRGGGGGGGGGLVVVCSQSVSSGAISGWTVTASAGGAGTSTGNGGTPGGGSAGVVILIPG